MGGAAKTRRARILARLSAAVAILALLTAILLTTAAQAAPGLPDLKVTALSTTGLGSPEHVVVKPDGSIAAFIVHVTVKNVGPHFSHPSDTEVTAVFEGKRVTLTSIHFHGLNPGKAQTASGEVSDPVGHIGFATLRAEANWNHAFKEHNRHNNVLERLHVAFLAQVWKVEDFSATFIKPMFPRRESTNTPTMRFVFKEYLKGDEAYIYNVEGGVEGSVKGEVYAPGCQESGSGVASHSPWPQPANLLRIAQTLTKYTAGVDATGEEPFQANDYCGETKVASPKEPYLALTTFKNGSASVPMVPSATTLEDQEHDNENVVSWEFTAELPGEPPPPPPPPPV
jgi:hypothetical protein